MMIGYFGHRTLWVDHRPIGTKQHFMPTVAIGKLDKFPRPVFRRVLIRGITRKAWGTTAAMAVGLVDRKWDWKDVLKWKAGYFSSLLAT